MKTYEGWIKGNDQDYYFYPNRTQFVSYYKYSINSPLCRSRGGTVVEAFNDWENFLSGGTLFTLERFLLDLCEPTLEELTMFELEFGKTLTEGVVMYIKEFL